MPRVDNKIGFVRLPWSFPRMFTGRYAIQSGRKLYSPRLKKKQIELWDAMQQDDPVLVLADGRRALWLFHDRFY